jgi:hypothetical protein
MFIISIVDAICLLAFVFIRIIAASTYIHLLVPTHYVTTPVTRLQSLRTATVVLMTNWSIVGLELNPGNDSAYGVDVGGWTQQSFRSQIRLFTAEINNNRFKSCETLSSQGSCRRIISSALLPVCFFPRVPFFSVFHHQRVQCAVMVLAEQMFKDLDPYYYHHK